MVLSEKQMETGTISSLLSEGDEDLYHESVKEWRMDSALTIALGSY